MKQEFSASVWQEGAWFIAQCLEVDVSSQGHTEDEALGNLSEALELYLEPLDLPKGELIEVILLPRKEKPNTGQTTAQILARKAALPLEGANDDF
jgi:predicted RNase H-like HicB family nuclease